MLRFYTAMEVAEDGHVIGARLFSKEWPDCWRPPNPDDEEAFVKYQDILYETAVDLLNEGSLYQIYETTIEQLQESIDELDSLAASFVQCLGVAKRKQAMYDESKVIG